MPATVVDREPAAGRPSEAPAGLDDRPASARLGWLTPRRAIVGTLGWTALYGVGSLFVADPFFTQRSGISPIAYWNTMYLHGLLVGMTGVVLLLGCLVFEVRARHVWLLVPLGSVAATLFATVGGVVDRSPAPTQAGLWTQVAGFFCLDEMLLAVVVAFALDWWAGAPGSRRLSVVVASLSAASMLAASFMGHLAGWILTFGGHPWPVASLAHHLGESPSALEVNLIRSHSRDFAVASMTFIAAAGVAQFAERRGRPGRALAVRRGGLAVAGLGVVAFTAIYLRAGFGTWAVPNLFAHGSNGLALDDLVTGTSMLGGLVALVGATLARMGPRTWPALAATWSWAMSTGVVVATGYWIELHEDHFGAGSPSAAGSGADAAFTWFHQDIGLFVLPLMSAVMILSARLVLPRRQGLVALSAIVGSSALFVGGTLYVFVDSTIHGTGYLVSTLGLLVSAGSVGTSIWWSLGKPPARRHRVDRAAPASGRVLRRGGERSAAGTPSP